jgi:hypothetical protein
MSEAADLWTLSRTGDPWVLLDRLIIDGQVEVLRLWFEDPESVPLHFGGFHYTDGLLLWDEPIESDIIRPSEGDFVAHIENLLNAPLGRLAADLRDQFRATSSLEEAHDLATRVLKQVAEFRSSASLLEPEDGQAQIHSALDDLESLVDTRLGHWSSGIRDLALSGTTEPAEPWSAYRESDGRYKYTQEQKEWSVAEWERLKSSRSASASALFVGEFSPAFQRRFPGSSTPDESTLRGWVRKSNRRLL